MIRITITILSLLLIVFTSLIIWGHVQSNQHKELIDQLRTKQDYQFILSIHDANPEVVIKIIEKFKSDSSSISAAEEMEYNEWKKKVYNSFYAADTYENYETLQTSSIFSDLSIPLASKEQALLFGEFYSFTLIVDQLLDKDSTLDNTGNYLLSELKEELELLDANVSNLNNLYTPYRFLNLDIEYKNNTKQEWIEIWEQSLENMLNLFDAETTENVSRKINK
ncbi:hypothetical protein SAMN04488134_11529 [Amphibacillus marinus]|uniref:Uncharacterized protein n=1 Tax=Amphibacillus marinus TaxID=872970 RepID=A0A1H8T9B5_9BACI|nr:hypothetical protein [Amphibacillus marinus]SEO87471.1 hypothetical protein SAMN04488134_11529 [Amphibacillus marinus]